MKKIGTFLFALGVGLSASSAIATDPLFACYNTCFVKYEDCKTRDYLPQGYCEGRRYTCLEACDTSGGQ
jgi:hypothetical protein